MLAVTYLSGLLVLQDRFCRIVYKITEESSQIPRFFSSKMEYRGDRSSLMSKSSMNPAGSIL